MLFVRSAKLQTPRCRDWELNDILRMRNKRHAVMRLRSAPLPWKRWRAAADTWKSAVFVWLIAPSSGEVYTSSFHDLPNPLLNGDRRRAKIAIILWVLEHPARSLAGEQRVADSARGQVRKVGHEISNLSVPHTPPPRRVYPPLLRLPSPTAFTSLFICPATVFA